MLVLPVRCQKSAPDGPAGFPRRTGLVTPWRRVRHHCRPGVAPHDWPDPLHGRKRTVQMGPAGPCRWVPPRGHAGLRHSRKSLVLPGRALPGLISGSGRSRPGCPLHPHGHQIRTGGRCFSLRLLLYSEEAGGRGTRCFAERQVGTDRDGGSLLPLGDDCNSSSAPRGSSGTQVCLGDQPLCTTPVQRLSAGMRR